MLSLSRHRSVRPPFSNTPAQDDRARIRVVVAAISCGSNDSGRQNVGRLRKTTAALILAASLIETSYVLASTTSSPALCGRRASTSPCFRSTGKMPSPEAYSDPFKSSTETYGQDVGDPVRAVVAKPAIG